MRPEGVRRLGCVQTRREQRHSSAPYPNVPSWIEFRVRASASLCEVTWLAYAARNQVLHLPAHCSGYEQLNPCSTWLLPAYRVATASTPRGFNVHATWLEIYLADSFYLEYKRRVTNHVPAATTATAMKMSTATIPHDTWVELT